MASAQDLSNSGASPSKHHDRTINQNRPAVQLQPPPSALAVGSPPCKVTLTGRRRWALTLCAHCRDYTNVTCVLTCYGKVAHHREVKLVDDAGVRDSVGVISDRQEFLNDEVHLMPADQATEGALGKVVRLNQDAVDRGVLVTVSCELCAGQPLGGCIDAGHNQQERFTENLPSRHTRRVYKPSCQTSTAPRNVNGVGAGAGTVGEKGGVGSSGGAGGGVHTAAGGGDRARGTTRRFEIDGIKYIMPTFIYAQQTRFKLEIFWGRGRFLVNGSPCVAGRAMLCSRLRGLTMDALIRKMAVRDVFWWEKTATVHPLIAAYVLRVWLPSKHPPTSLSPTSSPCEEEDDRPLCISLRGNNDPSSGLTTTRRRLRAFYIRREQLVEDLEARPLGAYADRPERSSTMRPPGEVEVAATFAQGDNELRTAVNASTPHPVGIPWPSCDTLPLFVGGTPSASVGSLTPTSNASQDSDSSAAPSQSAGSDGGVSGGPPVNRSGNGGFPSFSGISVSAGVASKGSGVVGSSNTKVSAESTTTGATSSKGRKRARSSTGASFASSKSCNAVGGGSGEAASVINRGGKYGAFSGEGEREDRRTTRNKKPETDKPETDKPETGSNCCEVPGYRDPAINPAAKAGDTRDLGCRESEVQRRVSSPSDASAAVTYQTVTTDSDHGNIKEATPVQRVDLNYKTHSVNGAVVSAAAAIVNGGEGVQQKQQAVSSSSTSMCDFGSKKRPVDYLSSGQKSDVSEYSVAESTNPRPRHVSTAKNNAVDGQGSAGKGNLAASSLHEAGITRRVGTLENGFAEKTNVLPTAVATVEPLLDGPVDDGGNDRDVTASESTATSTPIVSAAVAAPAKVDKSGKDDDDGAMNGTRTGSPEGGLKVNGVTATGARVASGGYDLELVRRIEEARFVECQRREMDEEKRRCREHLAPLEAQLEAVKEGMRRHLKEIIERHKRERFAFRASLFRDVNGDGQG